MYKKKIAKPDRGKVERGSSVREQPARAEERTRATPSQTQKFEAAIRHASATGGERYVLRLYVTGTTPKSARAIANLRAFCEEHLQGRYDLEVVDIYQQPVLARGEQIIAAPTLIKRLPAPLRKVVGDLSNEERVLLGLDLLPRAMGHDGGRMDSRPGRDGRR